MGIEEREVVQATGIENKFNKITGEYFPNLEKQSTIQIQAACRIPNKQDQIRTTRNISVTILSVPKKERVESCNREMTTQIQRQILQKNNRFFNRNLKARRALNDAFQTLKENNCQPRLLYPEKLSFIRRNK
jgi:hypothetical protein